MTAGLLFIGGDAEERGERLLLGRRTAILVTVRRKQDEPKEGETRDVRLVKGDVARALGTLRAASPVPED